ncbi:hypothetical protein HUK80_14190 [Flavobacterium sp. MAH-1]|uniref:Imelysin-like domain-containing protein n=1 Tax=Flavobacterium agri TaxID=2743471 RepID=A0A7Y9C6G9_9FLAO|nr:imelysin family protein [Flavobacterium agri]NUY82051.1 hypothetical protein [Flavobacterium agri]NYA72075.1 hypothetical protein [Flavobacterium agri]
MKNISISAAFLAVVGCSFVTSCSDDDSNDGVTKAKVIKNYADIAYENYKDAYDDAVELEQAINAFVANPTQATFNTAKEEWKESRESYGTTEAFRFANGPIDDADGPEGLINSWPLDEAYIDYVDGDANAGIINNPAEFPTITKVSLEALNQTENEESVSVGYHAIEFLLWGQDLTAPSANMAGQRPYTDFVDGGTASNQDRRRQYLLACADLLTDHLSSLVTEWQPGGAYRTTFLALPENEALQNMYLGIVTLASAELAVERMDVALLNMSQEDEHSCFSDNTHRDVRLNLQGIVNIYQGKYDDIDGPSLEDLVKKASTTAFSATQTSLQAAQTKMNATQIPFDAAISEGPDSTEGAKVKATVEELQNLGATFIAGAAAIGVTVNG